MAFTIIFFFFFFFTLFSFRQCMFSKKKKEKKRSYAHKYAWIIPESIVLRNIFWERSGHYKMRHAMSVNVLLLIFEIRIFFFFLTMWSTTIYNTLFFSFSISISCIKCGAHSAGTEDEAIFFFCCVYITETLSILAQKLNSHCWMAKYQHSIE